MDRMWIKSILREADKCYIPNILLLRVPCHHVATGSLELCTHNHRFIHSMQTHTHAHVRLKPKGMVRNTRKMHAETLIWACGIVTLPPDIPAQCARGGCSQKGTMGGSGWGERDAEGGPGAESQMRRVTWSNREDLRLIRFHIGSMVLWLQNARYGSEIRLRL